MVRVLRAVAPIVVAFTVVVLLLLSPRQARSQEPPLALPTPKGQLGGPLPVGQDPQPPPAAAASPEATRDIPAPAECQIEPRSVDDIRDLLVATAGTPVATPAASSATPQAGEPAPDDIVAGVAATSREFIACINAGDYPRLFALMTEAYLPQFLREGGFDSLDAVDLLAGQPQPLDPADQTEIIGVHDVLIYPDGHVSAIVTGDDPTSPGGARSPTFLMVQTGSGDDAERWLVDGVIGQPSPDAGTPAP
jgi:hypothetical protein